MIPLLMYKHLENKENLCQVTNQQYYNINEVQSDANIIKKQKDELKHLEEQEEEKIRRFKD